MNHRVYLGIKAHVVCIDSSSGRELWRTELRNSQLTTISVCGEVLIAYAGGHLFGLKPEDGTILWTNQLPGLGYGYCLIAGDSDSTALAAAAGQVQQSQTTAVNPHRG